MEFHAHCMDCAKFGKSCTDMTGTEPAGSCYISTARVRSLETTYDALTEDARALHRIRRFLTEDELLRVSREIEKERAHICKQLHRKEGEKE